MNEEFAQMVNDKDTTGLINSFKDIMSNTLNQGAEFAVADILDKSGFNKQED